jgi:uncharacterized Zn-finger protein
MTEVVARARPVPPVVKVSLKDLPLACPRPTDALWNMHPRVYLPLTEKGDEVICPYCGARYVLEG